MGRVERDQLRENLQQPHLRLEDLEVLRCTSPTAPTSVLSRAKLALRLLILPQWPVASGKHVSKLLTDVRFASVPWAPVVRMETVHSSILSILLLRNPQRRHNLQRLQPRYL